MNALIDRSAEAMPANDSVDLVDRLNATFYRRFQYPWPPMKFDRVSDPHFETMLLNQNLGDWRHSTVADDARIWVAGCGTNQAIFTALKFPHARVIGTDLSSSSLETSAEIAKDLEISNLELREENIHQAGYISEFDYIICTGVIHHTADPRLTLEQLAIALKPSGILELMVYNHYHRTLTTAFQEAVRMFAGQEAADDFDHILSITKQIIGMRFESSMAQYLADFRDKDESHIADCLLQPVEHSYTVESLASLADSCGMELLLPCINIFDKSETLSWDMRFRDEELQRHYNALSDVHRWHITNLLLVERSPMLWFYLQRKDSGRRRKTERQICDEFLETTFSKAATTQQIYLQRGDGKYVLLPRTVRYPTSPPDISNKELYDRVDGNAPMKDIFRRLHIEDDFSSVNQARINLTTSSFPYLRAIG